MKEEEGCLPTGIMGLSREPVVVTQRLHCSSVLRFIYVCIILYIYIYIHTIRYSQKGTTVDLWVGAAIRGVGCLMLSLTVGPRQGE